MTTLKSTSAVVVSCFLLTPKIFNLTPARVHFTFYDSLVWWSLHDREMENFADKITIRCIVAPANQHEYVHTRALLQYTYRRPSERFWLFGHYKTHLNKFEYMKTASFENCNYTKPYCCFLSAAFLMMWLKKNIPALKRKPVKFVFCWSV